MTQVKSEENPKKEISGQESPWKRFAVLQRWRAGAEMPFTMRLARSSHLVSQALEQKLGYNSSQFRILFASLDPEGVSQSSLHKMYRVDPAAITRTIQSMERDGLVTRTPDSTDNRRMKIYATEKGMALAKKLPAEVAAFEKELTEDFSDEEVLVLHKALAHLEERLAKMQAKS
ncbi:MAG TPA: MarR family transcriptional regulator [Chloroflexia bacterium]|nr:MarR family transcriptional regulator [Chloroflexia bacterium]